MLNKNLITDKDKWHNAINLWVGTKQSRLDVYTLTDLICYICYYLDTEFINDYCPYFDNEFYLGLLDLVNRFGLDVVLFAVDEATTGNISPTEFNLKSIALAIDSAQDYIYTLEHEKDTW